MKLRGIVPDGFWPNGESRPWRPVTVLGRSGTMAQVSYQDTGAAETVAIACIYSGNAPSDRPELLQIPNTTTP